MDQTSYRKISKWSKCELAPILNMLTSFGWFNNEHLVVWKIFFSLFSWHCCSELWRTSLNRYFMNIFSFCKNFMTFKIGIQHCTCMCHLFATTNNTSVDTVYIMYLFYYILDKFITVITYWFHILKTFSSDYKLATELYFLPRQVEYCEVLILNKVQNTNSIHV